MTGRGDETAIIIGGGIAGLAAALALQRSGLRCRVYEQAPELRAAGAGLVLGPSAVLAVSALGVAEPVRARGVALRYGELRAPDGRLLQRLPLAFSERLNGESMRSILRSDLQAALLAGLAPDSLRLGMTCVGFRQERERVVARFADGQEVSGDLLLGADGIHSAVRRQLLGDQQPRYAGYTAWRGLARFRLTGVDDRASSETWGAGVRFGIVPLVAGRIYWFATWNSPPGRERAEVSAVRLLVRGWHPPIEALLDATEDRDVLANDIYDRPPADRWGEGRVTLVGDAAHPTTPNVGQGAGQALEDAVVLAVCLSRASTIPDGLRDYERRRMARTTAITRLSWWLGQVGQWQRPLAVRLRNVGLRLTPPALARRQTQVGLISDVDQLLRDFRERPELPSPLADR